MPETFKTWTCARKWSLRRKGTSYIYAVAKGFPGFTGFRIFMADTTIRKPSNPLIIRNSRLPCLVEDILKHELVNSESFQCRSYADAVVSSIGESVLDSFRCLAEMAGKTCISAEISEIAENIRLAVEAFSMLPDKCIF